MQADQPRRDHGPHDHRPRQHLLSQRACIGGPPQDRKYRGGPTRIEIGDNNLFREGVTVHVGTEKGGGVTRIGNGNFFMVNTHAGHDVQIGNNCLFANNVMLGGHVIVGDNVNMMGGGGRQPPRHHR